MLFNELNLQNLSKDKTNLNVDILNCLFYPQKISTIPLYAKSCNSSDSDDRCNRMALLSERSVLSELGSWFLENYGDPLFNDIF